ncbi:MAG: HAD family hydrolase [Actinomycetota bacterium]
MLVLFDIDGTLLDDDGAVEAGLGAIHKVVAPCEPLDAFRTRWNLASEREFDRFLAGELSFEQQRIERIRAVAQSSPSAEDALSVFQVYLTAYEASWSLFPDVMPCLNELSSQRLGVVSNGHGQQQRRKLLATGILERFECVAASADVGFSKPAPQIFLHACELLGEDPVGSVYVGDRYETDAQGARKAGLVGVWLDRRGEANTEHSGQVIQSLDRLPSLLGQCARRWP